MKTSQQIAALMGIFVLLSVGGCQKGPAGPAGATGAQGPVGPSGPAGPQGDTGTANVIYSAWEYATDIRDTTVDGSNLVIATVLAKSLTAADITDATILVYFTFGEGVFPLPYTSYAGGKANTISFIPEAGQILITRFTDDNTASISLGPDNQYRFIIIPGGVSVPDAWDYATVMKYYHLPEY